MTTLFSHDYQVYISHTDAGGIVYHANHLSFYEHCRRDWFASLGLNGYFFNAANVAAAAPQHFVVTEANIQYQQPILLDQPITVTIDTVKLRPASMIFNQSIFKAHSTQLLSQARFVIACVQNQILHGVSSLETNSSSDNITETALSSHPQMTVKPVRIPETIRQKVATVINTL